MSGSGYENQIRVLVHQRKLIQPGGGHGFVSFDNGKIIITYPSSLRITHADFKPKEVRRVDPVTIKVNSGFLVFGWFTFKFDSEEDSQRVEMKLREIISG